MTKAERFAAKWFVSPVPTSGPHECDDHRDCFQEGERLKHSMQADLDALLAAEREACAEVCLAPVKYIGAPSLTRQNAWAECAAAIRRLEDLP